MRWTYKLVTLDGATSHWLFYGNAPEVWREYAVCGERSKEWRDAPESTLAAICPICRRRLTALRKWEAMIAAARRYAKEAADATKKIEQ